METLEQPSYESFGFTQCRTTLCDETDALGFRFDTVFEQSKMNKQTDLHQRELNFQEGEEGY